MELLAFEHHDPSESDGGRSSFTVEFRANQAVSRPELRVAIGDDKGIGVAGYRTKVDGPVLGSLEAGAVVRLRVSYRNRLVRGRYYYRVGLASVSEGQERLLHYSDVAGSFDVDGPTRIGLVDLEMQAEAFSIEPPESTRPPASGKVAFFLHLQGDLSALMPIVAACHRDPLTAPVIVAHPRLLELAVGARDALEALGAEFHVVDEGAKPETWLARAPDARAWVFGCESSLRPHRAAHELALAAGRVGKPTFTVQHGFENVGLTFFDEIHDEAVRFGASHVLSWHPQDQLPAKLALETRRKVISVGRPSGAPPFVAASDWPMAGAQIDVAIFENIHWHRYSEDYRSRFVRDLAQLCAECPHTRILIKPHPQGRWLTERYDAGAPTAENLVIANPADPAWRNVGAEQIISRAGLILTTPSTIALDAAQASAPVAVLAYDLSLPLYEPLMLIRSFDDLLAFVRSPEQQETARMLGRRFAGEKLMAGSATDAAWMKILELSATT